MSVNAFSQLLTLCILWGYERLGCWKYFGLFPQALFLLGLLEDYVFSLGVNEAVSTSEALLQVPRHSDTLESSQQVLTCPNGAGEVPLLPCLQSGRSWPGAFGGSLRALV